MATIKIEDNKSLPPIVKVIAGGVSSIFKVKVESIIF